MGETLDDRSEPHGESPETAMDLDQILAVLSEEDRALLILKYAEEYTYDELAEIFEITPSACKMRISRAREKVQEKYPDIEL